MVDSRVAVAGLMMAIELPWLPALLGTEPYILSRVGSYTMWLSGSCSRDNSVGGAGVNGPPMSHTWSPAVNAKLEGPQRSKLPTLVELGPTPSRTSEPS